MKKHRKRKGVADIDQPGCILYQTALTTISETDSEYYFEIANKVLTNDIVEAVAYLMRTTMWQQEAFWKLPLKQMSNIQPEKGLYWLSGGDDVWKNPLHTAKWKDVCSLYVGAFGTDVEYLLDAETLADIRTNIIRHLNLDVMVEFAMHHKIL